MVGVGRIDLAQVMVHGLHDHCRTWDDLVVHLQPDAHVIAPDLRGHGDSEWVKGAGYSYLDGEVKVADDLVKFVLGATSGLNREIFEAMAVIERFGKRNPPGELGLTLQDMAGQLLVNDRDTGQGIYIPDALSVAV